MKIFFSIITILILTISFSLFAQEKKDTIVAKTKHKVHISISQINELNYSNETKIIFKDNLYEHSGYSYSGGVTGSLILNKYFSIGSGLIIDHFYILFLYNGVKDNEANYTFAGIPIILDLSYNWKRISLHFIPEIRADFLIKNNININPNINVSWKYNNNILLFLYPKLGISHKIFKEFSLSIYFGIKDTLLPISQTNINSPWYGIKTSFYSLTGDLCINYKF